MDNFKCTVCGKMFSRKDNLQRHIKTHATTSMIPSAAVVSAVSTTTTSMTTFNCTTCGMTFSRLDNLKRHNAHVHSVSVNNNPPTSSPPPPHKHRQQCQPSRTAFLFLPMFLVHNQKSTNQVTFGQSHLVTFVTTTATMVVTIFAQLV